VSGVGSYSQYLVYTEPAGGGNGDIVVAAVPMDNYDATLGHLLLLELLVGAGVVVLLVLATWLIIRRGCAAGTDGDTARAIAGGELGRRSRRPTPPPRWAGWARPQQHAGSAAGRLRQRAASNSGCASSSRRLPELRTPLTSMRGYAELVRRNRA